MPQRNRLGLRGAPDDRRASGGVLPSACSSPNLPPNGPSVPG
jgi:hypothetical protein